MIWEEMNMNGLQSLILARTFPTLLVVAVATATSPLIQQVIAVTTMPTLAMGLGALYSCKNKIKKERLILTV